MPRTDFAFALLLAGLTALSRVPFRARLLPTWDAVQFALALREYDVVKHQPHPPGYVLYVAGARAVNVLVGDAAQSLTWLAIAASAVTVFLVYRLAWTLYGRPTALVAATGFAASPLFWFYGVVGLSYAPDALLATAVASLVWRMRGGATRFLAGSALALALAGGVRQSLLIVLMPLWLGVARTSFPRWRPVLGGCALLGLATAAWLVPMLWLAGGPRPYAGAAWELFDSTVRVTSIAGPPGHWRLNALGLAEALVLGLGLFLPALVWLVAAAVRRASRWGPRAWFFVGWIAPALALYTWVHFGQYGYLLTVLPALYILIGRAVVTAVETLRPVMPAGGVPALRWVGAACGLACVLLAHTAFFASAGPLDVPPSNAAADVAWWQSSFRVRYRYGLWATTAPGLREREQVIAAYVAAVRRELDPMDSALVTEVGNPRSYPWFRHVMYYLPEFPVYHLRLAHFSPGYVASQHARVTAVDLGPEILLPATLRRLVWVVDHWNPALPKPMGLQARALPYGRWLYVLDLDRRSVEYAGYRFTPVTAVARLR